MSRPKDATRQRHPAWVGYVITTDTTGHPLCSRGRKSPASQDRFPVSGVWTQLRLLKEFERCTDEKRMLLPAEFERRDCRPIVDTRGWPRGELDRARGCSGSDAEVSALFGGICRAVHRRRDFARGGESCVVGYGDWLYCRSGLSHRDDSTRAS